MNDDNGTPKEKSVHYNGTPHEITLYDNNNEILEVFPSNGSIRSNESYEEKVFVIKDFPYPLVAAPTFHGLTGLPDDKDVTLIVSMPVGQLIKANPSLWRGAVVGPDTGPKNGVRDKAGLIVGTKQFVVYKVHD
jgi:hypothetical protein